MRLLSVLTLSVCFFSTANAGEISYFNKTWDEIRAKAKMEGKYIIVDCYTEWCGWCKVMDKETMIQPDIVALISDKFVAVKMDMEHGEGVKLAMKYNITGYPTFMFFNPNGELVYMSLGYQKQREFTDELKNALDITKEYSAPGYTANINIDFPPFYQNAFGERKKAKSPEQAEVVAFLDKQNDLFSEVSWGVIARFGLNAKYNKFFLDNIRKYEQLYGSTGVDRKVNSMLMAKERAAVKNKNSAELDEVMQMADKYLKTDKEATKLDFKIDYYKETKEWDKFMAAFAAMLKVEGHDDPNYINSLCWSLYENCDDKKTLTIACKYMADAVAKEPKYATMDTYAGLLYKSGQVREAETWANKAIDEGRKAGEKTESTEELLKKIKSPVLSKG